MAKSSSKNSAKHSQRKCSKEQKKCKVSDHQIKLIQVDRVGFPILLPDTSFWLKLRITKDECERVTIDFPCHNFQVTSLGGGYVYTADGRLPEEFRPSDLIFRSVLAASDNGSNKLPGTTIPTAYIIQITCTGDVLIQQAGTEKNLLEQSNHIILPTSISYLARKTCSLKHNVVLSSGVTNVTGFPGAAGNDGFRDSHVNDAFDNVVAWSWTDNSRFTSDPLVPQPPTNRIMDALVSIGSIDSCGKITVNQRFNLTDGSSGVLFTDRIMAWDTAVAIRRSDKTQIVVSYGRLDFHLPRSIRGTTYIAVLKFNGTIWNVTYNGPLVPVVGTTIPFIGDYRGVSSDMYGNIWCSLSPPNLGSPILLVSTDGGNTFCAAFIAPPKIPGDSGYDFPQICFGGGPDPTNLTKFDQYGIWMDSDYFNVDQTQCYSNRTFIPIYGAGFSNIGAPLSPLPASPIPATSQNNVYLSALNNIQELPSITASLDGKVWSYGSTNSFQPWLLQQQNLFKTPGPIDKNYAGPFDSASTSFASFFGFPLNSQPLGFYFPTVQCNIFDDARKALYNVITTPVPYDITAQNARISFMISRDNGQTWSDPVKIANTDFANRGFVSMALDSVTGNLVFGWYDARNSPTSTTVQYFAAVIKASVLTKMVDAIPLSNPQYLIPSQGSGPNPPPFTMILSEPLKLDASKASRVSRRQKKFDDDEDSN